jgi:hypothetical protein
MIPAWHAGNLWLPALRGAVCAVSSNGTDYVRGRTADVDSIAAPSAVDHEANEAIRPVGELSAAMAYYRLL